LKLWCSKCYDRLEASRPRCRMSRARRFAIVRKALTDHGEPKDHGPYTTGAQGGPWQRGTKTGTLARRITARCLSCQYRDKNGFIVAIRKNKVD